MTNLSDAPPPPEIPDYELLRCIGQGSYGDVWLAQTATGVFRAVKVVWRDRFPDPDPYEREFRGLREFEKVSLVQPRQLALLHVARRDEDGYFYYVMELADDVANGREIVPATYRPFTLGEFRRRGAMEVARVVELGAELARGLAVLHDHGLVHRDIKPSNVVMVGGVPKLADVGLVAASTMALTFVGTEGFVAPEGPGTPGSDVFALGKVLFELVTGMDRKMFPQLPDNFEQRPDRVLFLELNAVIVRACDPDRSVRHEHARSLLDDLLLVQAGKSVRRLRSAERGLARALKVAAVLALVAAVAGAGAWVAWDRAQTEMALRSEAEAERDALARKTQYAGLLAQTSAALGRQEHGLSRHLAETAAEKLPSEVGPELSWMMRAAWGDVDFVVRSKGREIHKLAVDDTGQILAVLDTAGILVLSELDSGEKVARHEGISGLAGWSVEHAAWLCVSSRDHFLKIDGSGALTSIKPLVDSPETPLAKLTTLGLSSQGGVLVVEQKEGGRFAEILADGRVAWTSSWSVAGEVGSEWAIFRTALSPQGEVAVVAWVRGQGEEAKFRLTLVKDGRIVADVLSPLVRPGSLGWLRGSNGQLKLELVNDLDGARAVFDIETRDWNDASKSIEVGSQAQILVPGPQGVQEVRRIRANLWNETTQTWRRGHSGRITQVVAVPGTSTWITGSSSGEVFGWRPQNREVPRLVGRMKTNLDSLRFVISEDGETFFLPGPEGVRQLRASDGVELGVWSEWRWFLTRTSAGLAGISRDGRTAALVDAFTGKAKFTSVARDEKVMNVAANAAGNVLVYTRTDGSLWSASASGRGDDRQIGASQIPRWGLVVSEDASCGWFTTADREVVQVDLISGRRLWTAFLPSIASHVDRIEARGLLVVSITNGDVHILDETTGSLLHVLTSGSPVADFVLASEDGRRVLVGGSDGRVHVFDAEHWLHLGSFGGSESASWWMLGMAGDGSRLAGLSSHGQLHVIEEAGGR